MLPNPTDRLRFRDMVLGDLENMAGLLGDPAVMTFYPAPKTLDGAREWIGMQHKDDDHGTAGQIRTVLGMNL